MFAVLASAALLATAAYAQNSSAEAVAAQSLLRYVALLIARSPRLITQLVERMSRYRPFARHLTLDAVSQPWSPWPCNQLQRFNRSRVGLLDGLDLRW